MRSGYDNLIQMGLWAYASAHWYNFYSPGNRYDELQAVTSTSAPHPRPTAAGGLCHTDANTDSNAYVDQYGTCKLSSARAN